MYPRLMQLVVGTLIAIVLVLVGVLTLQPTPAMAQLVCQGIEDTVMGTGTGSTCDEARTAAINDALSKINCPEIVCVYGIRSNCTGSGPFNGSAEVDYSCEDFP